MKCNLAWFMKEFYKWMEEETILYRENTHSTVSKCLGEIK